MSTVMGTTPFMSASLLASSRFPQITSQLDHIQHRQLGDSFLGQLSDADIFIADISCLRNDQWLHRMDMAGSLSTIERILGEFKGTTSHSHLAVVRENEVPSPVAQRIVTARPALKSSNREFHIEGYFQPFATQTLDANRLQPVKGLTRDSKLSFYPPPYVPLNTQDEYKILQMLEYAGIHYETPRCDAARYGVTAFDAGRRFVFKTNLDFITFDWDHTLSNYQIFEEIAPIIRAKLSKQEPPEALAERPMTALEVARPFMQELVLGMMVGYAFRQGLTNFQQWEQYKPQVGIVTHTWPDRLGVLAEHFVRLLPLMEGLLPGTPGVYNWMTHSDVRSITHLHHFLSYAESLLRKFEHVGLEGLTETEQAELMGYMEDGKAHYRKPLGTLAMRGWEFSSLLHFDDSTKVINDLVEHVHAEAIRGLWVRQPHSKKLDVGELNKIVLSSLWRSREAARLRAARNLIRAEEQGFTLPYVLSAMQMFSVTRQTDQLAYRAPLPAGTVFRLHETPTTVGEYWRYYVNPTNRLKQQVRAVRKAAGGLRALRHQYKEIRKKP